MHLSCSTTPDSPVPCADSVKAKKCLSYEPAESNSSRKEAPNAETDELTNGIQTPVGSQSVQIQDACEFNGDTPYENHPHVDGLESGLPEERLFQSKNHSPLRNEPLMADMDNIDEVSKRLHLNKLEKIIFVI